MSRMENSNEDSRCRGCGKKVVWVSITKADGKPGKVPLDPAVPVYDVDPVNPTTGERNKSAMASHFATCPKADQFSGGGK